MWASTWHNLGIKITRDFIDLKLEVKIVKPLNVQIDDFYQFRKFRFTFLNRLEIQNFTCHTAIYQAGHTTAS